MILRLKDPGSLEEDMGVIILDACVSICEGPTKRNVCPEDKTQQMSGTTSV